MLQPDAIRALRAEFKAARYTDNAGCVRLADTALALHEKLAKVAKLYDRVLAECFGAPGDADCDPDCAACRLSTLLAQTDPERGA